MLMAVLQGWMAGLDGNSQNKEGLMAVEVKSAHPFIRGDEAILFSQSYLWTLFTARRPCSHIHTVDLWDNTDIAHRASLLQGSTSHQS
jgi:hypothetical protein